MILGVTTNPIINWLPNRYRQQPKTILRLTTNLSILIVSTILSQKRIQKRIVLLMMAMIVQTSETRKVQ